MSLDSRTESGQAPAPGGEPTRFVDTDGCFNFRDLGGYRTTQGRSSTRWRTLFRADGLHRLTDAGSATFTSLDVATVVDLRTPDEVADRSWTPPVGWSGTWRNVSLRSHTPDWSHLPLAETEDIHFAAKHYLDTAVSGGAGLAAAVATLSAPGALPAVFHCAAGKDRTGILAALVLRLLGVPADTVAEDYALSETATARWEDSVAAGTPDDTQTAWSYVPPAMLRADRSSMLTFLRVVDADFGSIEAFAASIGIDSATVGRLRGALLI